MRNYLKSLTKKLKEQFVLFYGHMTPDRTRHYYTYHRYDLSYLDILKLYFKNPGLVGLFTGVVELFFLYWSAKLMHACDGNRVTSVLSKLVFILVIFAFAIPRSLVALIANIVAAIFYVVPYHLYQYNAVLKTQEGSLKQFKSDGMNITESPRQNTTTSDQALTVSSTKQNSAPLPSTEFVVTLSYTEQELDLQSKTYFELITIMGPNNTKIINGIKLNSSGGPSTFMPMYSDESKQFLSRLIWLGILEENSLKNSPIKNTILVKNMPMLTKSYLRWANEEDEYEQNTLYPMYFFIALFAKKYNIPEDLLPVIWEFVSTSEQPIALEKINNDLCGYVSPKKNAHVFFAYQANKVDRIQSELNPNSVRVTEALLAFNK